MAATVTDESVVREQAVTAKRQLLQTGDHLLPMPAASDGLVKSKTFPGLWLDGHAFLKNDGQRVLATLQNGLDSEEHAEFTQRLETKTKPELS